MVKNKLLLCKEYHIQPSEIDRFVYYEYEWILEEINVLQKQQEEYQEAQQEDYENMRNSMNMRSAMSSMKSSMPNMGSMKMPTMSMPQVHIPKM